METHMEEGHQPLPRGSDVDDRGGCREPPATADSEHCQFVLLVGLYSGAGNQFPVAFMYDPTSNMLIRTLGIAQAFYRIGWKYWDDQSVLGGVLFTDSQGRHLVWNPHWSHHRQLPSTSAGLHLLGVCPGEGDDVELMVGTQNLDSRGVKWKGGWYWLTLGINGMGGSDLLRYDTQLNTSGFVLAERPAASSCGEMQDITVSSRSLQIVAGRLHCVTLRQVRTLESAASSRVSEVAIGQAVEIWRLDGDIQDDLRWVVAATMSDDMFQELYIPAGRGQVNLHRVDTFVAVGGSLYIYSGSGRGAACDLSHQPPAWRRLPDCNAPFTLSCCFSLDKPPGMEHESC